VVSAALPSAFIVFGVRRGRYQGRHLPLRRQRLVPFLVWLASTSLGWAFLSQMGAPWALTGALAAIWISLAVATVVNQFWQMSLHTGMAATCVGILCLAVTPYALALAPVVVLSGWARVRLGAHTPAQVAVGALAGALAALAALALPR
jgi:membrane-associated phospholipid phosphatase